MSNKIILASKSKVRKEILKRNGISVTVEPSFVDEDIIKKALLKDKATPEIISKNLAEIKANKISLKKINNLVLGADSVIDLNGELISKPENRDNALKILKKLNNINDYYGKNNDIIWAFCKYFWESHIELPHIDINKLEKILDL